MSRISLLALAVLITACAHEAAVAPQVTTAPVPAPAYAAPVTPPPAKDWIVVLPPPAQAPAYPAPETLPPGWVLPPSFGLPATAPGYPAAETAAEYPEAATGYAEAETAPPPPVRPSPPPLGAANLAGLPEAAAPARGASLRLAQDGRMAWLNREPVVARQKLQSALQLWGGNGYAKYYLGILELEAGHYAQAESFARDAARRLKDNPFYAARAYYLLALSLERAGDAKGAFAARARADELDPRVELK
jgi:hypothetical protein